MKAYIKVKASPNGGFYAEVVSEQDYHERGPAAHSYRSPVCESAMAAENDAYRWVFNNGYTVVEYSDPAFD